MLHKSNWWTLTPSQLQLPLILYTCTYIATIIVFIVCIFFITSSSSTYYTLLFTILFQSPSPPILLSPSVFACVHRPYIHTYKTSFIWCSYAVCNVQYIIILTFLTNRKLSYYIHKTSLWYHIDSLVWVRENRSNFDI